MTDAAVFWSSILATLASFAESGWFLTGCLILAALLILAVLWMICLRGVHLELDELERWLNRGDFR